MQDFLRVKEVSVNNRAGMMGVPWDSPGQVETYDRLLKIIFKYLKVCYVEERLNLIGARDRASAHRCRKTRIFLLLMSHRLVLLLS